MRKISLISIATIFSLLTVTLHAAEIHDAVRAEDLARVKALVEKDQALVHARTPNGNTPLFDAVMKKNLTIAEFLVSKGADVRAANHSGMTVLHVACRNGSPLDLVRFLVEKGADVNAVAKYQGKPLDLAWEADAAEIVSYLESRDAGFTPPAFETFKLSDRLYRIAYPWGMRNNVVVWSGKDGALIVDTGFNRRSLDAFKKIISDFGADRIRYVVNTHDHWDHVGGNSLAPSKADVIGFQKLDSLVFAKVLLKGDKPLTGKSGKTLPAPCVMKINGEEIAIIPYPGLHSEKDILIHFRRSNVLCMGDLLLSQSCPALGEVSGYMELLDKVIDVFPETTTFVSGHGKDLTWDGLKKYRDDLARMIDIVRTNRSEGKTAEDMIRADVLKAYKTDYTQLDWLGPDRWISSVVENLDSGDLK